MNTMTMPWRGAYGAFRVGCGISRPQAKQNLASRGFLVPHLMQNGPARSGNSSLSSRKALSISSPAVFRPSSISLPAALNAPAIWSARSADAPCVAAPHFEQKLASSASFTPHFAQNGIISPTRSSWRAPVSERHDQCPHHDGNPYKNDECADEGKPRREDSL